MSKTAHIDNLPEDHPMLDLSCSDPDRPTVFVGGFPKSANTQIINEYVKSICKHSEFILVTDSMYRSRGFVFITFNTLKEAKSFVKKNHVFEGKILDCKISLDHEEFITASLNNIRAPKKVFVDKIPRRFTKHDLEKLFGVYGDIEEVILIEKDDRKINFGYVTYLRSEAAKKCCAQRNFDVGEDLKISAIFARPKFSKKMLIGIHPVLKEYIKNVQKGLKPYDPKDFAYLQDVVLKECNTRTTTTQSNSQSSSGQGYNYNGPQYQGKFIDFLKKTHFYTK